MLSPPLPVVKLFDTKVQGAPWAYRRGGKHNFFPYFGRNNAEKNISSVHGCYNSAEVPCVFPFRLESGGPLQWSCIYEHDPMSIFNPGFYWCPSE